MEDNLLGVVPRAEEPSMIQVRSAREVDLIEKSCRIVGLTLVGLREFIRPGVTTLQIAERAEEIIQRSGGIVAFRGYRGFPGAICTSINEEVVHGIPGPRSVEEGDIIGVDVGVFKDGYYGDAARTYAVGTTPQERLRLLEVTEQALRLGIGMAQCGRRVSDISHAIQTHVESCGCSVVRDLCGHGIGSAMHEPPEIPNFGGPSRGPLLKAGMVLAIEPMVNVGGYQVRIKEDGWTVVTADGLPSAHFENTVVVTTDGPRVLTQVEGE